MTDETLAPALIGALEKTLTNPTPEIVIEDIFLVYRLAREARLQLAGKHEGLMGLFWNLFNLPLETVKSDKV